MRPCQIKVSSVQIISKPGQVMVRSCIVKIRSGHVRLRQIMNCSGHIRSGFIRIRPGQVRSSQVRSGQNRSGQVKVRSCLCRTSPLR